MKILIALTFLLSGLILYGQTDSTEKAILLEKYATKEIGQAELSNTLLSWKQAIKEFEKYPDITLDNSGEAHYIFLKAFPGFNKEKLFARTLEWLSINYGITPSGIYSNMMDGKIILRNSIYLTNGNSFIYSSIITIKNEKLLIEYINIGYRTLYEAHLSNEIWIPEKTVDIDISDVYPIILRNQSEWRALLKLLKTTNELIINGKENLYEYITGYDNSYKF